MTRSTKKQAPPSAAGQQGVAVSGRTMSTSAYNIRETVESIVVAFVLAFLFRTFEAEAFVIPTGSMAPTLRGRHKDVICEMCGYRFQSSASIEVEEDEARLALGVQRKVLAATCPMCRHTMSVKDETSFPGDRILVNKFVYQISEPERWDVIVFKYPGDAKMNYIKRLVGLPGETVRIHEGDIFVQDSAGAAETIARKPHWRLRAMLQDVHDTDYQPAVLARANWPFRWQPWPAGDDRNDAPGWTSQVSEYGPHAVRQTFSIDGGGQGVHWLRYRHFVPSDSDWQSLEKEPLPADESAAIEPQLITDYYAYNTSETQDHRYFTSFARSGLHWVGDLLLQCDATISSAEGTVILDLVEAGRHFSCRFDVASATATLGIDGLDGFAPQAIGGIEGPGRYRLELANVDDELLVWVNGRPLQFDAPTVYDTRQLHPGESSIRPRSSAEDPGDLAPAGVGAEGVSMEVTRLRLRRDVYYIANQYGAGGQPITDYDLSRDRPFGVGLGSFSDFLSNPAYWDAFSHRQSVTFPLESDQFFVLGDNSPFSKDGRLWHTDEFGHYVERQLLIGKALFIYWPHSWNRIPGTSIPFPYFPNFADMGLVR
jgi:signal peptidase I